MIDDTTVLGLFKTRAEAEAAVSALQAAGFEGEDIGLLAPGELHEPPAGSSAAHRASPRESRKHYEQQVEAGSSLVAVRAGARGAEADAIMKAHGAFGQPPAA